MALTAPPGHQPRSVALVYGGIAAALLVVIATVALVVAPPSPPGVAEFAPQADKPIDEAPNAQQSQFGAGGDGACAEGQRCATSPTLADGTPNPAFVAAPTTTAKPVIEKARVRRCVGNPPRQTEDPQSPPCVGFSDGRNPGATSRGVTANEILVGDTYNGPRGATADALYAHFNRRYELYGRKLTRVPLDGQDIASYTQEGMQVRASDAKERGVFAVPSYSSNADGATFFTQSARNGIVAIANASEVSIDTKRYADLHPHLWSYRPAADTAIAAAGQLWCRGLRGRPARFAGGAEALATRSLGVVRVKGSPLGDDSIRASLAGCGTQPKRYEVTEDDTGSAQTTVAQARADGVTTLACICGGDVEDLLFEQADNLGYTPEWLQVGIGDQQDDRAPLPGGQPAHRYGIGGGNKIVEPTDEPWYQAVREELPDFQIDASNAEGAWARPLYQALLVLASGIQAAGPNLTPATFAAGLQGLRFPNPGAGASPFYQGAAGFPNGSHSMLNDFPLVWYDPSAQNGGSRPGSWCFVDRGRRTRGSDLPNAEPAFFDRTQPCR